METVRVLFIMILVLVVAEYCCISAESLYCAPGPIIIHRDDNGICLSEIKRENALQLLKNVVSAKLSYISSSITTDGTTSTNMIPCQSNLYGGPGGNFFDDHNDGPGGNFFDDHNNNDTIVGIVGMRIRAEDRVVNSIQVTYRLRDGSNYTAPMHGQTGGTEYSFTLADGENLIRMEGEYNQRITTGVVDSLTFYSNMNNVYGPYGTTGQIQFSFIATKFVAFFGRAGSFIDAIGVYYIN